MSEEKKPYSPQPELVSSLSRPALSSDRLPEVASEEVQVVTSENNQSILLDEENTQIAVEHIKDTLSTLKSLLHDLKELAPASQQGFLFQTAAIIAKTRLEGSNMLAALQGTKNKDKEEKRGGARSNHLHLNVTSAEFGEFVASQVKKAKNGKE